jgi:DNA repair protein RecO (recombination protein O)
VASLQTQALVLRTVDFGESDRIVHILTPETARVTAIAKGAKRSRRRFSGTLDLFNHLAVHIERRRPAAMARLEHTRLLDAFPALRAAPVRFALACYLAELIDRLAPEGVTGAESRRLFAAALAALRAVAVRTPDERLRALLELRLLDALGLRPELSLCVRCGRTLDAGPRVAFHVGEGGPLCPGCTGPGDGIVEVHLGTLRALDQGLRLPLDRLDRLSLGADALAEASALLARFRRFHAGVELRSERFLDQAMGRVPWERGATAPP